MDYVKLGPFIIFFLNLTYKLDLPAKMKIYLIQHIAMLKPAYGSVEPPLYEIEIYKSEKENKWDV